MLDLLVYLAPPVILFALVQVLKRYSAFFRRLEGLVKQFLIVTVSTLAAVVVGRTGLPVPPELQSIQTAAIIGLLQGLGALGVYGVRQEVKQAQAERPPA